MRALIADDDPVAAVAVSRSMSNWGFETTIVHDGLAAWDHLNSDHPPSLAVIDWEMPGLEGPELCKRVRSVDARAHLYIVLLTARNSSTDLIAGLDAGADDYLIKPVDLNDLPRASRLECGSFHFRHGSRRRSPSCNRLSTTCASFEACCPSVRIANASATMAITGSVWRYTCQNTPTPPSPTVSVRRVSKRRRHN